MNHIDREFGQQVARSLAEKIRLTASAEWIMQQDDCIRLTASGWMVSDYIVSNLME